MGSAIISLHLGSWLHISPPAALGTLFLESGSHGFVKRSCCPQPILRASWALGCPWRQKPPDASLLFFFLSWEHTVVPLCQTRVYHMWFSLLQLSLQRINRLWQLMGLRGSVCSREGKSHHFGGVKSQFGKIALACMPPPNTTNCFKG